jgi:hypothetical protein
MKTRYFIIAAAVVGFAACKTPYKATDKPMPSTNSTSSAIDTAASMKPPVSTDSANVSKMDSTSKPFTDTSKVSSPTDTARVLPGIDTTANKMGVDSTHLQPADSAKSGVDSSKLAINKSSVTVKPTVAIETAFTKQYANAANVVWANYDSLANVPIDMRLTGWKKMDSEDYMAKFDFNGETYYAWYDNNGKWIGSTSAMTDFTKLPAAVNTAVKNAMKTRYQGYTISQVNREFQTGSKTYEVELTKDDSTVRMLVNSAGKITQIYKYKKATK